METFEWLDATFNGGLLKFDAPRESLSEEAFNRVAGDIAYKADAQGQLSLPERWAEVDFAHIPVGLLSEVYEAVAHDRDKATAAASSLFYTPRHIAEYVVEEVLDALGDTPEPRILDPAAGAGVFLVAAFRALARREWVRSGSRPTRQAVRSILSNQLRGFDIDSDALRLAELALYLTAIELDPDVRPRPLEVLRFRALRGHTLIVHPNGSSVGSLDRIAESDRQQFDAVIGNPPWTALPKMKGGIRPALPPAQAKAIWTDASRPIVEARLGAERAASFSLPDMNPDLPFVYRAMEWAKPGGVIGLLTHARWLFAQSPPGSQARKDLLEAVHITGILNGTDLRRTQVWPNVTHPFCILFARNEPPPDGAAFHFVSPERDTSDPQQDQLRLDWHNAEVVETAEVVRNPWLLKCLYRGNAIDESIIRHVTSRGILLSVYLEKLGTKLANGYQAVASAQAKPAPEMQGLPDIRGRDLHFTIRTEHLPRFTRTKLHRSRDRSIYRSPLLVIHESVLVDRFCARTGLAFRDLAYDERFDGISFAGVKEGETIARYLQILMQSSLFLHLLLMLDGQLGVEREVVHLQTIENLPIIPWRDLERSEQSNAASLSEQLADRVDPDLQDAIDNYVFRLYQLSQTQQQAVLDTLATALPTTEAYSEALRSTTVAERKRFASLLEESLVETLQISGLDAEVTLRPDMPDVLWRFVQVDIYGEVHASGPIARFPSDEFLEAANEGAASLVVLQVRPGTFLVGILDRYRYWTLTRGRLLASVLLAENGRD